MPVLQELSWQGGIRCEGSGDRSLLQVEPLPQTFKDRALRLVEIQGDQGRRCDDSCLRPFRVLRPKEGDLMAKARKTGKKDFLWNPGEVNDKQQKFLDSTTMFTCYGG